MSCKLSPTGISSLIGNVDKLHSFNIDFTNPHLNKKVLNFNFVNKEHSQLEENDIDFIEKTKDVAYVWTDFHRPVSMEILGSVKSSCVRQVEKLATIHVLPGSVRELKEAERNESVSTVCFSLHQFKITESKMNFTDPPLDYFPVGEDLHCITPCNYPSGIWLNFTYEGSLGKFNQSMIIGLNPKLVIRHKLLLLLRNVQSLEAITRFVQVKLKNKNATFVQRHTFELPGPPTDVWFSQKLFFGHSNSDTKDRTDVILFESENEFSPETQTFASESCNDNYRQKDGLFSVATNWQRNEMLKPLDYICCHRESVWLSRVVHTWDCYHCPFQIAKSYHQEGLPSTAVFGLQKR